LSVSTVILLSFGLAMDAFAVSVAAGLSLRHPRPSQALTIASLFGAFQAGMPVIGWSAGVALSHVISGVDHWVAFVLLSIVGGRMILESRRHERRVMASLEPSALLLLSVATSIDALAAGITLPFVGLPLLMTIATIGAITFLLCLLGVYLGARVGHLIEELVEIGGGLILIGIGFRILVEHLFWV
jgi:putative Mn2+ efflux pump MntP